MDGKFKGWSSRCGACGCAVLLVCVSVAMAPSVVASIASSSAPSFAGPRSYPAGSFATNNSPGSVAIGDLNGDGKPELATANRKDTVSVLVNNGDGSFRAKRDYRTGHAASSLAIGDLNGDGKLDLATGNFGDTVSVLLNPGDGSFQAGFDYGTGRIPSSIAIGELNGDRWPDLATANSGADTVSVLLNRTDGSFGYDSFGARRDYRTGKHPTSIAIGNLNGDRWPDLATANPGASSVSVLLNRGDGSFGAKRDYRTGNSASSLAIGDLNDDGKLDLATAGNTVSVLLNRGDGSFRPKRNYPIANYPTGAAHVAIGDVNGDGEPDLATAHPGVGYYSVAVVSVLVNGGDGRFQARLDHATGDSAPSSLAIGDLSGDGKLDLAIASFEGYSVSVLLNRLGLCTVQNVAYLRMVVGLHDPQVTIVAGEKLPAAKRTLARANCRVGKIRRAYSKVVRRGRVIAQKPKFGRVLPGGGKVNLVVSRGRKP